MQIEEFQAIEARNNAHNEAAKLLYETYEKIDKVFSVPIGFKDYETYEDYEVACANDLIMKRYNISELEKAHKTYFVDIQKANDDYARALNIAAFAKAKTK